MVRQVLAAKVVERREVQEAGITRNPVKNVFSLVSFPGSAFCLMSDREISYRKKWLT